MKACGGVEDLEQKIRTTDDWSGTEDPERTDRASDCSNRGFTISFYGRTSDTELIKGEHDHGHSESQRR